MPFEGLRLSGGEAQPPTGLDPAVPWSACRPNPTTAPRSGTSSPAGGHESPRSRLDCCRAAAAAGCPACGVRRSPCWPESAPTGTPGWRRATSTVSPMTSSTRSRGRCSSTRPNAPICSTSLVPVGRRTAPRGGAARRSCPSGSSGCSTPWTGPLRSSPTGAWTFWRSTASAGRCTHRCSRPRCPGTSVVRRTSPGSSSSTPPRATSPRLGRAANVTAALLRTEAGRDPHNKDLRDLVGELSTLSDEFRTRWAAHDVRLHHAGNKQFNHPDVGVRRPRLPLHGRLGRRQTGRS